MTQANIVFLIDINSIQRDLNGITPVKTGDSILENQSTELFPFSGEGESLKVDKCSLDLEQLEWLKELVLTTLYKEANNEDAEYDYGRVQWSFKFFDSSRHVDFKDGRTFFPFDDESFSSFERQIQQRFKRSSNSYSETMSQFDNTPIKFLSDTLKAITGTLSWPESPSLNLSRSFQEEPISIRNIVYTLFRVPRTDNELIEFADLKQNSTTKDLMKVLLPDAFSNTFHHKLKIQLNLVDMWTAPENSSVSYLASWNGEYPKQLVKCLQYLGGGRVFPAPCDDFRSMKLSVMKYGLIPYIKHLRLRLKEASQQNENLPSHLQRLADRSSKGDLQKTFQSFDAASSISRSIQSSSLIDTSLNIQSKLRQFGVGGMRHDHHRDEVAAADDHHLAYHRQSMANIRAQDRARERKRKRLEMEYDDDDYAMPFNSQSQPPRRGFLDNSGFDSVDTDSVSGREQLLEKWVNDGVFATAKRKKHVDVTSSAVPMSRPALSKTFHTFQEPAPKQNSSRGQKMLATVERQKLKVNEKTKRRSSEGLDTQRMMQNQEVELSALKRRLNHFLSGDLDDDTTEPMIWLRKFKSTLRRFADMIVAEETPSLVPLAQALVNYASLKLGSTPGLLASIRQKLKTEAITAKDLLKEVLLIDFANLNLKIIKAHEEPRDRHQAKELHQQKVLAFREAELQVILRVEISWCFVAPNADATEDLLMEVVRLLNIIGAYRTRVPIEHFITSVLLPNYIQGTRFMRELYKKMNLEVPLELTIAGSPVPGPSRRDDDSSMISSTSSANLYPEDSASQLHIPVPQPKRHRISTVVKRNVVSTSAMKKTSGSKKSRPRQIMVATSNPTMSQFQDRSYSQQKKAGGNKSSPKRVRRNLFDVDVQKKDRKDSKILLALSSSRLSKSPGSFKSPKSKSPSGFFRAARSRRQLTMTNHAVEPQFGSPQADDEVLCPESPATPGDRRSMASKHTSSTPSTVGRKVVIQESPVGEKHDYDTQGMTRVASLSFYSVGSAAAKSRAWEKSGSKLMAAKIKDAVDLSRKEQLSLSDIEFLSQSPSKYQPSEPLTVSKTPDSVYSTMMIAPDSIEKSVGVVLSTSISSSVDTLGHSHGDCPMLITAPAPDLQNPEIHALITTTSKFASPFLPKDKESNVQYENGESPKLPVIPSPSNMQTPSKRVQFNLNENLVNTPSSHRKAGTGTPKSILKETYETLPPE